MDALGFTFPVDLAPATKLIGSVAVKELEPCSSLLREKSPASAHTLSGSDVTSWNKITDPQPPKHGNQLSIKHGEASSGVFHNQCKNGLLLTPKSEGGHVERKTTKFSRNGGSCPKRPRVAQLPDPSLVGADGINDMSQQFGFCTLKCPISEKPQSVKQKNILSKRGDKRSPRVHVKTKNDSFSVKGGLTSFGSTSGGNNLFGVYGLKSDNHDATQHIDDLPLIELFCGNYQPPSLGKDKENKPALGNDSFLDLVRKSCSILQPPRSIQSQNTAETDSCSNKKMSPWLLSANSVEAGGVNGDTRDPSTIDVPSCSKDTVVKSETPVNPLDVTLYQPLDILQRLMLPPPKDLESLLLDATKPPLASKNLPDMRSGKQVARRVSLPPFPWSHTPSGHCRASSDSVKMSTIKGTCPGRWLRVGKNSTSSFGNVISDITDLESLTYDQSLVPSGLKTSCLDDKVSPNMISTSLSGRECNSSASCLNSSCATLVSGGKVDEPGNVTAGNCPKLLAAAQTLYDIATRPSRQNLDRVIRWPKKSSQKAMKARKLKSHEKTNEPHPTPALRSESLGRSEDIIPLKKPKLTHTTTTTTTTNNNKKKDLNHLRKEPVAWSAPRSSRSSPGKTVKDSIAETRYPTASIVKQSYMMMPPPPARVPDNTPNGQHKLRKLMPFEWNRGRDR